MKNLIYPHTGIDQCQYNCITIQCVKSNCFPTNTLQSQLVPSIIGCTLTLVYCYIHLVPPINFVESPNDIDLYAPYLFLDINIQKSYSSASLICHAYLPVMNLPEIPTTFQFIYHMAATKFLFNLPNILRQTHFHEYSSSPI